MTFTSKSGKPEKSAPAAQPPARAQDASAGDNSSIPNPTVMDPAGPALLDKAMTPNQPPPIHSDTQGAREAEIERQREVAEAVRLANQDVLPTLGGNTREPGHPDMPAGSAKSKGKG